MSEKEPAIKKTKRMRKPTSKELLQKAKGIVREAERSGQDRPIGGFEPIWIDRRSKKNPENVEKMNIFAMLHPDWRNFVFDMFQQHEQAVKHLQDQLMITSRQINMVMERLFLPTPDEVTFRGHKLELVVDALKDFKLKFKDDDIATYRIDEMVDEIDERLKQAREQVKRVTERNKPPKPVKRPE